MSSEKHKLLTVDTSERSLEFVSSVDAAADTAAVENVRCHPRGLWKEVTVAT